VTEGLGPQQDTFYANLILDRFFLGTTFTIIGYPDNEVPSMPASILDLERSIEIPYALPRVLIDVLAVVETFLINKIAESRYNRNVLFIVASTPIVTLGKSRINSMELNPQVSVF
jgi:hypothetical protein